MNRLSNILTPTPRVLVIFCFTGYLLLATSLTHATTCANNPDDLFSAVKDNEVILHIEVIDEKIDHPFMSEVAPERIKRFPSEERKVPRQTATVEVKKLWKGEFHPTLTYSTFIYTTGSYFLDVGESYLFYGWQSGKMISTSVCSPTSIANNKEVEMGYLDRAIRGDSREQLQEYLLEVLESNQEGRIRAQTLPHLRWDWPHLFDINIKNTALNQRIWQQVSIDPAPEIRIHALDLMPGLYYTIDEMRDLALKQLKDESAIVRQKAAKYFSASLYNRDKPLKETKSLLKSVVLNEKEISLTDSPREYKAQREMVQDILHSIARHENHYAQPWMLPFLLKDAESSLPGVQLDALDHLTENQISDENQKNEVLNTLMRAFNKFASDPPTSRERGNPVYQGSLSTRSINKNLVLQKIAFYLLKHGREENKKYLLTEVLKYLKTKDYHIRVSLLKKLEKIQFLNDSQKNEVLSAIYSEIERRKKLAVEESDRSFLHRDIAQTLIGHLIENNPSKENRRFLPDILLEFRAANSRAYINLQKLKPLDDDLLEQLEEAHRNADPEYRSSIRGWINQLRK